MQVTQTANFTCHIVIGVVTSRALCCSSLWGKLKLLVSTVSLPDSKPAPAQVAYSYAHHLEVRFKLNEVSEQKWLSSPLTTIDRFHCKDNCYINDCGVIDLKLTKVYVIETFNQIKF